MKDIVQRPREKPRYTMWQNTRYVLSSAWRRDKRVLFTMLAKGMLVPAIPAVAMLLPTRAVALILAGAGARALLATVLAFTAAALVLQTAKSYLDSTSQPGRIGLRGWACLDILDKAMTTDYINLESKAFTDAKQKAHDITQDNSTATEQVYITLEGLLANLLGFGLYMALLIGVSPLVLALAAATTTLGYFVRRWANRWRFSHEAESIGYNKRSGYLASMGQNTGVAKDIRLFSMTGWLEDIYRRYTNLQYSWQHRAERRQFLADAADCAATLLREGAAYAYLIWQVLYGGLPVDQFVLLFAAIGGFSGWIMGILGDTATLHQHSLDYCRLREFLEFPETFKRTDGAAIAPQPGKTHALELRNVSFRYPGAEADTLRNINLTVKAGEKLAIVGLNGAGKTTLVKLLCGLYDPTEGAVLLDGRDIRQFDRDQYYALFTAVFQEFNILPVTIGENVAQQLEAAVDRARLDRCLALAGLTQKVAALPGGADALLGKAVHEGEAVTLSGGETQRLMLARALYKDAPILILDEPTAALDPIAESQLYQRYSELSAGKTALYISHRLASTRFCDRIIFMGGQSIAESGTHEALLAAGGGYARLYAIQSKYYQKEVQL